MRYLTQPHHAGPSYACARRHQAPHSRMTAPSRSDRILVAPELFAPVCIDNPVFEGAGDHPAMPPVLAEDVAFPTQCPKVAEGVGAPLATANVVSVASLQGKGIVAADTLPTVALPRDAPQRLPNLAGRASLRHLLAVRHDERHDSEPAHADLPAGADADQRPGVARGRLHLRTVDDRLIPQQVERG